jgi:hypothetical protein
MGMSRRSAFGSAATLAAEILFWKIFASVSFGSKAAIRSAVVIESVAVIAIAAITATSAARRGFPAFEQ